MSRVPSGDVQRSLREAELDLYDALVAGDNDRVAALLDKDLIYIHTNGAVEGFEAYLKALRDRRYVYGAIEAHAASPRAFGDAALLVGTTFMSVSTDDGPMLHIELRSSLLWTRTSGTWLLLLRQTTKLP